MNFAEKLAGELERRQMGARTLARQIDPEHIEHARKTIRRWLAGKHVPTQASRDSVTDALGLERGALDPDSDEEESLNAALHRDVVSAILRDESARDALRRLLARDGAAARHERGARRAPRGVGSHQSVFARRSGGAHVSRR